MPERYLCDVLEEMRKAYETRNFSYLLGLIEEAQTLANRMEAGLGEKRNYQHWHDKMKKLREEHKELLETVNAFKEENKDFLGKGKSKR